MKLYVYVDTKPGSKLSVYSCCKQCVSLDSSSVVFLSWNINATEASFYAGNVTSVAFISGYVTGLEESKVTHLYICNDSCILQVQLIQLNLVVAIVYAKIIYLEDFNFMYIVTFVRQ